MFPFFGSFFPNGSVKMPPPMQSIEAIGDILQDPILVGERFERDIQRKSGLLAKFPLRRLQIAFSRIERAAGNLQTHMREVRLRKNEQVRAASQVNVSLVVDVHAAGFLCEGHAPRSFSKTDKFSDVQSMATEHPLI